MPNTYSSDRVTAGVSRYEETGAYTDTATYTAANGDAIVATDTINMIKVPGASAPGGLRLSGLQLITADLGTCTFSVGDSTDTELFMKTVDCGAAQANVFRLGAGCASGKGFSKVYTADDTIKITVAANTGNVVGAIELTATFQSL